MYVHGDNLEQKESHQAKYLDAESKAFLKEIRSQYNAWKQSNIELKGPWATYKQGDNSIIVERVKLFSDYKDFIDQQKYAEKFDSRSNLHSTVLEEFMFYLFRDLVFDFSKEVVIGKSHTFKDIFFISSNFEEMTTRPNARIEIKDHDFVIGVNIKAKFQCEDADVEEHHNLQIPAVAIECKTYLDKTMLEGSSAAAEQLLVRNPNAIYIVVAEWLKLTEKINLRKFKVNQIYILRKQRNTDREYRYLDGYEKNPIFVDVVEHLYETIRKHLTQPWESNIHSNLQTKGFLL